MSDLYNNIFFSFFSYVNRRCVKTVTISSAVLFVFHHFSCYFLGTFIHLRVFVSFLFHFYIFVIYINSTFAGIRNKPGSLSLYKIRIVKFMIMAFQSAKGAAYPCTTIQKIHIYFHSYVRPTLTLFHSSSSMQQLMCARLYYIIYAWN